MRIKVDRRTGIRVDGRRHNPVIRPNDLGNGVRNVEHHESVTRHLAAERLRALQTSFLDLGKDLL